jgi:hypothetical protein
MARAAEPDSASRLHDGLPKLITGDLNSSIQMKREASLRRRFRCMNEQMKRLEVGLSLRGQGSNTLDEAIKQL